MNIKQVRYFVAVFQSGSLSAAAKEQYVTVQAVSKAIADLERELKNELFVRESRGVHPTLFGKAFYVKAEPVLRSFDELEAFAHRRRSAESPLLRLGLCASPLYGYEQACASIASFVYKNSGIETSIRLEAGLRGFGALQAGHLDALIVVGACRHPDMDCLNLGKVMLGVIMSYRHPLAQHQTVSLDDIKPYPVSISEDFDRFNDSVAEFYRERGIDILVSATTAAQFERYLTRENGLALTVGVPALGQFNPPHRVETHGGQGFRFRAYLPRQPQRTQGARLCGLRALDDERACRQRRRSGQEVRVHDGFYSCMF